MGKGSGNINNSHGQELDAQRFLRGAPNGGKDRGVVVRRRRREPPRRRGRGLGLGLSLGLFSGSTFLGPSMYLGATF